jgi:hypothetical protein
VRTVTPPKQNNTSLSEQFQTPIEQYQTDCSHRLVLFLLECGTVLTVWYCFYWSVELFLRSGIVLYWRVELFSQSGIVVLESGTVLTVWYCFIGVWNCSHSLVLFYWGVELFLQSGIVFLGCGTVFTGLYCFFWVWECFHSLGFVFVRTVPHSNKTIPDCENSSTLQ